MFELPAKVSTAPPVPASKVPELAKLPTCRVPAVIV